MISVIIPVYNVERHLRKCVNSVLNQNYTDIEIILVDDGSTDKSGKICDELQYGDSRIKVIHKKNGGLSSARNSGLDAATGDFIAFLDSDDYIETEMLSKMIFELKKNDADIVLCGFRMVDGEGKVLKEIKNEEAVFEGNFVKNCFSGLIWTLVWNKLYKRDVFDDLRFIEGKWHEDEFFAHEMLFRCKKAVVLSDVFYNYLQRLESITGGSAAFCCIEGDEKKNRQRLIRRFDGVEALAERVLFFKEQNMDGLIDAKIAYLILFLKQHVQFKAETPAEERKIEKMDECARIICRKISEICNADEKFAFNNPEKYIEGNRPITFKRLIKKMLKF